MTSPQTDLPKVVLDKSALTINGADIASLMIPVQQAFITPQSKPTLWICILHQNGAEWLLFELALAKELDAENTLRVMVKKTTSHKVFGQADDVDGINPKALIERPDAVSSVPVNKSARLREYLAQKCLPILVEMTTNPEHVLCFVTT